ncbi:MAG TPA: hypothetical protein VM434_05075 [Beijerinckiaceae bacterium]|nr:hypothetical protein [Beijerinckiaceae bacterium]
MLPVLALALLLASALPAQAEPISTAIGLTALISGLGVSTAVAGAIGGGLISIAISAGLSLAARALAPKEKRRQEDRRDAGPGGTELTLSADPTHPRTLILGRRAVAGSLVYWCTSGPNNATLHLVIALADHECASLEGIFVDGKPVTWTPSAAASYQVPPEYNGDMAIAWFPGTASQEAAQFLIDAAPNGEWTADHRGDGIAYVIVQCGWNQDTFKGGGVPTFLFDLKGARLYDPRKDSTMPGGSGAHRWGDRSTYEWTDNLEVARYNYLRGIAPGPDGHPLFGVGLSAADIDHDRAVAAMNACDEAVALKGGGTEPRYRVAAVVEASQTHRSVLEKFTLACAGDVPDLSGRYALTPGVPQVAVAAITDADLIADAELAGSRHTSRREKANEVTGQWADPAALWQRTDVPARWSPADEALDGGFRRAESYDLDYVGSGTQGQRVLEIMRRLDRRERSHVVTLGRSFAYLEAGDWIAWTSDVFGHVGRTFRIEQIVLHPDWRVQLHLREVDSAVYAWTAATDELDPANPQPLASGGPELAVVSGFAVETATVEGADGTQIPALRGTWIAIDDPTVVGVRIDYRRVGDAPWQAFEWPFPVTGACTITDGIVAGQIYEARATPVTNPPRTVETTFPVAAAQATAQVIVHQAAVAHVAEDLRPGVVGFDDLTGALRAAVEEFSRTEDILAEQVIAAVARHRELTASTRTAVAIRADVALGLNPLSAGIERIDQVKAELQGALAQTSTTLHAEIAGVATSVEEEALARVQGDEAEASARQTAVAQLGDDISAVNQQVQVIAAGGGLTATDQTRIQVQQVEISDDSTLADFLAAVERGRVDDEIRRRVALTGASIEVVREATVKNGVATAVVSQALVAEKEGRIAAVTSEASARASAIAAEASQRAVLESRVDDLEDDVSGQATAISGLSTSVTTAQQTADGKNVVYVQDAPAPGAFRAGDLWIRTDEGRKLYRATAPGVSSWVVADDQRIPDLVSLTTAQAAALTALDSRLDDAEGDIAGQATAIQALDTRVTDAMGDIDSFAGAVTTVTARASEATGEGKFLMAAVAGGAGVAVRLEQRLRSIVGEQEFSAGEALELLDGGATRKIFNVDNLRVQGAGHVKAPFEITAGGRVIVIDLLVQTAHIDNLAVTTLKVADGAISTVRSNVATEARSVEIEVALQADELVSIIGVLAPAATTATAPGNTISMGRPGIEGFITAAAPWGTTVSQAAGGAVTVNHFAVAASLAHRYVGPSTGTYTFGFSTTDSGDFTVQIIVIGLKK